MRRLALCFGYRGDGLRMRESFETPARPAAKAAVRRDDRRRARAIGAEKERDTGAPAGTIPTRSDGISAAAHEIPFIDARIAVGL